MERVPNFDFTGNVAAGELFPPAALPILPDFDARTRALEAFGEFLSTLEFQRTGEDGGDPLPFKVSKENIHVEEPDHAESRKHQPGIAFLPGRATYVTFGIGPSEIIQATVGVFGRGTALLNLAEYNEVFTLETWSSKRAERRAMLAGIETAMSSGDDSWALRLILRDYFDVTATFALNERENIDDPDAAKNRRKGNIYIELTTCMVRLVRVNDLRPAAIVLVDVD